MAIPNFVLGFVVLWIMLYIVVYFVFMAPDDDEASIAAPAKPMIALSTSSLPPPSKTSTADGLTAAIAAETITVQSNTNFFVTEECDALTSAADMSSVDIDHAAVVIVARNVAVPALMRTIDSLFKNSANSALSFDVTIVDDYSDEYISNWDTWNVQLTAAQRAKVHFMRLPHHSGVAYAKNHAAKLVLEKPNSAKTMLVFLDPIAVVSENWLLPLAKSLTKYPHSIVYPVIDILSDPPPSTGDINDARSVAIRDRGVDVRMIRSDNMVAAFDWGFGLKWESAVSGAQQQHRLKYFDNDAESSEVLSPSAPSVFAINAGYFKQLNTFDHILYSSYMGQESTELALRTWLCGGIVLRQSCSRVARYAPNVFTDTIKGNGATADSIDRNVMNIANKWLSGDLNGPSKYRELVFQHRFLNRVPYMVETSMDSMPTPVDRHLIKTDITSKLPTQHECLSFDWYLSEVYPGLLLDAPNVKKAFDLHILGEDQQSHLNYLEKALSPLTSQYKKSSNVQIDNTEVAMLQRREQYLKQHVNDATSPSRYYKKEMFKPPPAPHTVKLDKYAQHVQDVVNMELCEDIDRLASGKTCTELLIEDPLSCTNRKPDLLFNCPKTCGFCMAGKFCEDQFLQKCPKYFTDNMCSNDEVEVQCPKSCGLCTPDNIANPQKVADNLALQIRKHNAERGIIQMSDSSSSKRSKSVAVPAAAVVVPRPPPGAVGADSAAVQALTVNPFLAQQEWSSGSLPDEDNINTVGAAKVCNLKGKPNGQVLDIVNIAPTPAAPVKIFCGIYTMEKNHKTNVKATKSTWAKRCDGFIAFSTMEDPSIPSVKIEHEGEEAYDNMWQKSRSIWKFIAANLADQFDYFVLGGDDMFYIVENLRAYLSSLEISQLRDSSDGLYIGRVFQPPNQIVFNSGGAGYTLDQKAVKLLAANIDTPKCFPHQKGFWEDVNVANCLQKSEAHIVPYDTRDPQGRERFHPFTPGLQLTYRIPKTPDWYAKYNPNLKIGMDCCSPESVSFHYVPADLLYQLYSYTYHCASRQ